MDIEYEKITHCELCNDSGLQLTKVNGTVQCVTCSCHNKRLSLIALYKSGFYDEETGESVIDAMRFNNFKCDRDYRREMHDLCQRFIAQSESRFLYLSGQTGCGKTHLGTAVCGYFIDKGADTIYTTYKMLMIEMKSKVNDDEAYGETLRRFGSASVLYIDDFMKFQPSKADVDHTFELINLRVVGGRTTILTSERSLDEIIGIDEALGSRIKQKCGRYSLNITRKSDRNYRTATS
jgi:DNA replication protein DnaC